MRLFRRKDDRRKRIRVPIVVKIFLGFMVAMIFMLLSNLLILHRMVLRDIVVEVGKSVHDVAREEKILETITQIKKLYISYDSALKQKHKDAETKKFIKETPEIIFQKLSEIRSSLDSIDIVQNNDSIYLELQTSIDNLASILQKKSNLSAWNKHLDNLSHHIKMLISAENEHVSHLVERSEQISKNSARFGILLTLGMLFLSTITALIIAGRIARPIANLRRATHYARLGKYNQRVPFMSHDEIADLTADFNAMMEALGKLEKMKAMFLSSITHDLKSPLYRVKLGLENLQDEIHGKLTKEQKHAVDNLLADVETLSRLIYDILDIQKMEDGKFELHRTRTDLAEFVRNTVKKHSISFADKGVGLKLRMNVSPRTSVLIDTKQIERVFENLLSNALKFTPAGGMVTVSADFRNNLIYFSVQDNGAGIPADELDKIFDKFFRASTGKNVRGTGLGLAIAKQIITAHGGRIWAESEIKGGTTFNFVIPSE